MLVKHIRDANDRPFATLVATSRYNLGLAICCPKDQYSKQIGTAIAKGRAVYNQLPYIPNRNVLSDVGDVNMMHIMRLEIGNMVLRAQKYFKP